jgi:23S rRNA pseudouridine1911/1915/1917 synthase
MVDMGNGKSNSNDIKIIFEDNHLLVVEKPPNMLTQGDQTGDEDLLTALKEYIRQKYDKPGNVYLGLVHRLDRPAGGVMVFAKTSKAASRLSDQMRTGAFGKTYLAVVHGVPDKLSGTLVNYLVKDEAANTVKVVDIPYSEGSSRASHNNEGNSRVQSNNGGNSRVHHNIEGNALTHPNNEGSSGMHTANVSADAKKAVLDYEAKSTAEGLTLVQIRLRTGRPHQIRVQFAAIGHPLYGDQKYGASLNRPGAQLALWSAGIAFIHPTLKEPVSFSSDPPQVYPWSLFK